MSRRDEELKAKRERLAQDLKDNNGFSKYQRKKMARGVDSSKYRRSS